MGSETGSTGKWLQDKPDRVQEALGQFSQTQGVTLGVSFAGLELDLMILIGPFQLSMFCYSVLWRIKTALNLQRVSAWGSVTSVLPVKFVCNQSSDRTG